MNQESERDSEDIDERASSLASPSPFHIGIVTIFAFIHFICLWLVLWRYGCYEDEWSTLIPMAIAFLWTVGVTVTCVTVLRNSARQQQSSADGVTRLIGSRRENLEKKQNLEKKLVEAIQSLSNELGNLKQCYESKSAPRDVETLTVHKVPSLKGLASTIHSSETRTPSALDMSPIGVGTAFQNLSDSSQIDEKAKPSSADPSLVFTSECELKVCEASADMSASVVEEKGAPADESTDTASEDNGSSSTVKGSPVKE